MLEELGLFEEEVAFRDRDDVEELSNFGFEFLSDLVILTSEVEPTTGVSDVEHEFVVEEEGSDEVKVLFA